MNKFSMLKRNDVIWLISANQFEVLEIDNPKYYLAEHVKTRLIERPIWIADNAEELDSAEYLTHTEAGNLMRIKQVRQAIESWDSEVALELEAYANQIDDGNPKAVFNEVAKLTPDAAKLFGQYSEVLRPLIKYDPDLWELLESARQHLISAHEQFAELVNYMDVIGGARHE